MVLHNRDVRTDVRELGALVGDVLSAQTSTEAYETVEDLRHAAIDYRRGDAASRDILRESVEELSTTERRSSLARSRRISSLSTSPRNANGSAQSEMRTRTDPFTTPSMPQSPSSRRPTSGPTSSGNC